MSYRYHKYKENKKKIIETQSHSTVNIAHNQKNLLRRLKLHCNKMHNYIERNHMDR
jgi:hypothetical protein